MKSDIETIMPNDRWVILQSFLNRNGIPVNETSMTIEVFGVYSLPEFWAKLEASGSVDSWSYQFKLGDALVADGKFNQRELTEDEKKELDNKKKPPPKIDKKNLDAVREEQERIEKLQQEKEEAKRKLKAELDSLEPMQRFYRIKETPTNEAWISYEEDKAKNTVLLSGESLISIEEAINEKKGIVIQFNKVPPPDENEKKRPKPKNLNPEDIKPVYTVGWADLTDFYQTPGRTEVILRTNLILKETYDKRIANNLPFQGSGSGSGSGQGIQGGIDANQGTDVMPMTTEQQEVDYVEQAKTYVYFKICFTEAINPHQSSKDKVAPEELINNIPSVNANKKAESTLTPNAEPKPITADEMCTDLRKYIKIFINSIAKSYDDSMGDNSKNSMIKRDKTAVLSNAKREERDGNITNFLYKYIENGRARPIKEKLKKFITRIALEKYKKRTNINTPFAQQKDQFYSELYAYLFDEIKLGMDEFFHLKKDELHENIVSSYEQSRKEAMNYAIRQNKEPEEKRLLRLSKEYEIMGDLDKSMYYYKCRLTLIKNKDSWLNYAILAKKINSLVEVEEAINKCIGYEGQGSMQSGQGQGQGQSQSQSQDDFNLKLIYSAVKWLKGRLKDAIDILLVLLNKYQLKGTNCNFNAFLAFLYKEKGNTLLYTKHYETAKRFKMIELGYKLQKPKVNPKVKTEYKRPVLPVNQCDNIWYTLIKLFNEYQFYEVSERLLEFIDPSNQTTTKYLLEYAQILLFKKENDKVIHLCDEVLKHEPENYLAWATRGNGYHFKNNLFDSEESYVKAIRCKPQNEKFNIKMLFRLGLIYVRRKTWEDAKTVFLHILKESVYHSFAWRYLGLALTRLQDFTPAEEAINEAILLDIENPLSWSFMTFYCIDVGRTRQALQCLKEVLKMNYGNIEVLAEIAAHFYHIDEYSTAAELYQRIIEINQRYIDGHIKLAEIYFMKYEDKKKEAITILRNSLNYCDGEREKNSIMDFIAMYENQISNRMNNDINITSTSKINDREPGDSFNNLDHPFLNE